MEQIAEFAARPGRSRRMSTGSLMRQAPGTCTMTLAVETSPPRKARTPTMPSLPMVATSTLIAVQATASQEMTPDSGK